MNKINVARLKILTPGNHGQMLREPGGITGRVRAGVRGVTVLFRYEVWLHGKKQDYALGSWPKKTLTEIRAEHYRIRTLIANGIDPKEATKALLIEQQNVFKNALHLATQAHVNKLLTVQELFHVWFRDGVARQDNNKELARLFAKDVLPVIGQVPISDLNEQHILTMLRQMRERGITRQVVIAYNDLNQMLSWGVRRKPWRRLMQDGNPCDLVDIKKLLPADYEEERDRILSVAEIRELHAIFQRMNEGNLAVADKIHHHRALLQKSQFALWLCLGTICRIGELLQVRWEHVDLETRVWFIPRANVKGTRHKKQEHYVFLSDYTHGLFTSLKEITGYSAWCFPSKNLRSIETHVCLKSVSKQVGDRQALFKKSTAPLSGRAFNNELVLAGGAHGKWTPHDLRRTGATMMQALGINLDVIDRCQNHIIGGSRVRRHYLHYDYREEKMDAWQKLGEQIMAILSN